MALADEGVDADTAREAVRRLVRESDRLPTIHRLLTYCVQIAEVREDEHEVFPPPVSDEDRRMVREAAERAVKHLTGQLP